MFEKNYALNGISINESDIDSGFAATAKVSGSISWESEWTRLVDSINEGKHREEYTVGQMLPARIGKYGVFNAMIIAMDADRISGTNRIAAFTFLLTPPLTMSHMNPEHVTEDPVNASLLIPGTGAVDGWMSCSLRKWLKEEAFLEFPEIIQKNIVAVDKVSRTFTARSQIFDVVTEDKLWIPSKREVFGPGVYTELTGPVYKTGASNILMNISSVHAGDAACWLRSVVDSNKFRTVKSGNDGFSYATLERGVAVGFCFGVGKTEGHVS